MYESAGRDNEDPDSKVAVFIIENVEACAKCKARSCGLKFFWIVVVVPRCDGDCHVWFQWSVL